VGMLMGADHRRTNFIAASRYADASLKVNEGR
jgi:hypothetical protein